MMKKYANKDTFLVSMFIVGTFYASLYLIGYAHFGHDSLEMNWRDIPNVFFAALFFTIYQHFTSVAYKNGNMTSLYALTLIGPVFIPIWAGIFLNESLSLMAFLGILITIIGAMILKLKSFSKAELVKVYTFNEEYKSARLALLAAIAYSFGAVLDKSKVANFSLQIYIPLIMGFMTVNLLILQRKEVFTKAYYQEFLIYAKYALIGGMVLFLSFYFFRVSLQHVFVSVAVPIRQVSIICALFLGWYFLHEKITSMKTIGSLIIILGIIFVAQG